MTLQPPVRGRPRRVRRAAKRKGGLSSRSPTRAGPKSSALDEKRGFSYGDPVRMAGAGILLAAGAALTALAVTTADSEGGIAWTTLLVLSAIGCAVAGVRLLR